MIASAPATCAVDVAVLGAGWPLSASAPRADLRRAAYRPELVR